MFDLNEFKKESFDIVRMYSDDWAVANAWNMEDFGCCTIAWGSLGNLWTGASKGKPITTIYVNPLRFTHHYLLENPYFSVSFLDEKYRDDLLILGTKSKRDCDKVAMTKLTPKQLRGGVTYEEARLTFLCRLMYHDDFKVENMSDDYAKKMYSDRFPPHTQFIGEIVDVIHD